MKNMVRTISILMTVFILIGCYSPFAFAVTNTKNELVCRDGMISIDFIKKATVSEIKQENGNSCITLNGTIPGNSRQNCTEYEKTCIAVFPDSVEKCKQLICEINALKSGQSRGSGSFQDSGWFNSDSLCIASTLNYTTLDDGITYGRLNSVYTSCSVYNSFVIDSISLKMTEQGFQYGGGTFNQTVTYTVSNWSTTSTPSTWPYVVWGSDYYSVVGAIVSVTGHRGTSSPSTFRFVNNIIG